MLTSQALTLPRSPHIQRRASPSQWAKLWAIRSPRLADVNMPRRVFAVFGRGAEVQLRRPNVSVPCQLLHLLDWRAVLQSIGERRLAKGMDADAAAADTVGFETGSASVALHDFPDHGAIQKLPKESFAVPGNGAEERPFEIIADAGSIEVGEYSRGCFEQGFPLRLAALFANDQIPLEIGAFDVADAGIADGRTARCGLEVGEQQAVVAQAKEG